MLRTRIAAFALGALVATPAAAHPGHGDPALDGSWLHYALTPEHFVPLALVLAAAASAIALHERRAAQRRRR